MAPLMGLPRETKMTDNTDQPGTLHIDLLAIDLAAGVHWLASYRRRAKLIRLMLARANIRAARLQDPRRA
jgi:hypothetical protein